MTSGEQPAGVIVSGGPLAGVMALVTGCGETGGFVSGVGGFLVILGVAGIAVGGRAFVLPVHMTGAAVGAGVAAVEQPAVVIEVGLPVAGAVALGAVMGETRAGMLTLIVAAVAAVTVGRRPLVCPVGMAGVAVEGTMTTGEFPAGVGVVGIPVAGGVALYAIGVVSGGPVVGVGGPLVFVVMACEAVGGCTFVLSVRMTGTAVDPGVTAVERPAAMIEIGAPVAGAVALSAIMGEARTGMFVVVVAGMTGVTVGGRALVLPVRVTGAAVDCGVTAVERPAVMAEVGIPVAGAVALGAVVGITGSGMLLVVIAVVTGIAVGGCTLVLPARVTGTAVDVAVTTGKLPTVVLVVGIPVACVMTLDTPCGKTGGNMTGVGGSLIVTAVAGKAVGGRAIILSVGVTGAAINRGVAAVEWPAAMGEIGIPTAGAVTQGAVVGCAGSSVLPVVVVVVTGVTVGGRAFELPIRVTIIAVDGTVAAV